MKISKEPLKQICLNIKNKPSMYVSMNIDIGLAPINEEIFHSHYFLDKNCVYEMLVTDLLVSNQKQNYKKFRKILKQLLFISRNTFKKNAYFKSYRNKINYNKSYVLITWSELDNTLKICKNYENLKQAEITSEEKELFSNEYVEFGQLDDIFKNIDNSSVNISNCDNETLVKQCNKLLHWQNPFI